VKQAEAPQTRTVNIDKTPPIIAGMPNPHCVLWPPNGVWHHVASISALDGLSGVAEDSLRIAVDISDGSNPEIGDDPDSQRFQRPRSVAARKTPQQGRRPSLFDHCIRN
jgi:hypothetical protein